MAIYKNKDIEVNVNEKSVDVGFIDTNFYTEDKSTSSIRITIKNNKRAVDLSKTNLTPKLDLFHSDGSIFMDENINNVLPEQGIIQYKISDKVIKHPGKVNAKLFLKNETQSVHVANFNFTIKDSGITEAVNKEITVNIVDDSVRRIIQENAIELLGEGFKDDVSVELKNYVTTNTELFKGPKGDKGEQGIQGLKGDKGDEGIIKFENLTDEQKLELKADMSKVDSILLNKGKTFPLRDDRVTPKAAKILDESILSVTIEQSESGAQYKIYRIDKDNTAFTPTRTMIGISKKEYGSSVFKPLMHNPIGIVENGQTGIQTHVLKDATGTIREVVTITIDWESINTDNWLSSSEGDGYIIHPQCYLNRQDETRDSITINKGNLLPMQGTSERVLMIDNAILDVKIHYADVGAEYRLYHISKNNTGFTPTRTMIGIQKKDVGSTTWSTLYDNNNGGNLPNGQTGIKTHILSNTDKKEVVTITINWDAATTWTRPSNSDHIISPVNYFFRVTSGGAGVLPEGRIRYTRTGEQDFIIELGDSILTFGPLGINQITHPVNIKHTTNHIINTDWISPYQAGTVTNETIDNNHASVSGNHGTVGGSGFRTANTETTRLTSSTGVNIEPNGRTIEDSRLNLVVVNNVTTLPNINLETGERRVIDFKETVTYTFEYNHMQVHTKIEAINPFYVHWYFGLQLTRDGFKKDAYYTNDDTVTKLVTQTSAKWNSGTKANSPNVDRVTMRSSNMDVAHVYVDKDYGIGYSHIADNDTVLYLRESFLKMYFHLVKAGSPLILDVGETSEYKGGYIFTKNKAINATNVSRFVENGVLKALVDFKTIVTEPIEYKEIEESKDVTGDGKNLASSTDNAWAKIIL